MSLPPELPIYGDNLEVPNLRLLAVLSIHLEPLRRQDIQKYQFFFINYSVSNRPYACKAPRSSLSLSLSTNPVDRVLTRIWKLSGSNLDHFSPTF